MSSPPDPPDLEACREQEFNYEEQRKAFLRPISIRSLTTGSEIIDIPTPHHPTTTLSITQLTPDTARSFAHKPTAIYVSPALSISALYTLFTTTYPLWFPLRPHPTPLYHGASFAIPLKLSLPNLNEPPHRTSTLRDICAFHTRLADQLSELAPHALTRELSSLDRMLGVQRVGSMYAMCASWRDVFVWVDRGDWREAGVLVVARDGDVARGLGLEGMSSEEVEVGWVGGMVFRVGMERAVRAVMGLDGNGGRGGREWNYVMGEWFGGCVGEEGRDV